MLAEMQDEAEAYLSAGEYSHALAEFSVLREIRSRREGPYSVMYLSNLHDCVRCMSELQLWADSTPLCRELHGKYVRTHGRGQSDTVDVAKHWAWALVHLHDYPPAVQLYLTTADALWDSHPAQARRLLAAAVAHRTGVDPAASILDATGPHVDPVRLAHGPDVEAAMTQLIERLPADVEAARAAVTIDGLELA
ncbi:hypothetical protein VX037_14660 [Gordonia sp. Z-3]|jgi:hypothetical protein|uniref:Tetratricopeptide repeat protein n=1 Tax=Gordonia aquimaris TaxID=2984863 RepID=A0A9X3D2Z0_9ACTN|nr:MULTISPECIES: hypothetical protein [Gordonia]MCX2963745.1 hypothetical protein [Gordonia aquimaris]MED5802273.1 hypothetical protein [Gordonia sp. Z-3]